MVTVRTFLGGVVLVFAVTFWAADGLRHEPAGDESHFLESSEVFHGRFGVEALRSYPEVVTPLALVIWGELDYFTGDGLFYGRLLNMVLTFAMVCLVAFSAPRRLAARRAGRGGTAAVSVHRSARRPPLHRHPERLSRGGGHRRAAAQPPRTRVLRILVRDRDAAVHGPDPAALAAAEALGWLGGQRGREKAIIACVASCLTVLAWIAFFGGLANEVGLEDWLPFYPAPMMTASSFIVHHGMYTLTGVGAFFVVVEALLFRRHPVPREMWSWRGVRSHSASRASSGSTRP